MSKVILSLIFLASWCCFSQNVHHQMISSQGKNASVTNGIIISQTIGQQSLTGTSINGVIVQQGFQQNNWSKIITAVPTTSIVTTTYPNPFVDIITFQFSTTPSNLVRIEIYDILGRLLFNEKIEVTDFKTSIIPMQLPSAEYLVKITAPNYTYFTKIIKK
jgi:hypothetical protein